MVLDEAQSLDILNSRSNGAVAQWQSLALLASLRSLICSVGRVQLVAQPVFRLVVQPT